MCDGLISGSCWFCSWYTILICENFSLKFEIPGMPLLVGSCLEIHFLPELVPRAFPPESGSPSPSPLRQKMSGNEFAVYRYQKSQILFVWSSSIWYEAFVDGKFRLRFVQYFSGIWIVSKSFDRWSEWRPDKESCCGRTVDQQQEPMSRSVQLPYLSYVTAFLQAILFLVYLVKERLFRSSDALRQY